MANKKTINSSLLLYGKNVLVSGAAAQYAEAIVMALAADGASIILVDKQRAILKDLASKINKKYGLAPLIMELDLSHDRDQPYQHICRSLSANNIKHLDGLVTLGYHQGVPSNTLNFPTPLWKDNIQANLDGVFILVKNLLPFLLSAKNPNIILSLINDEGADHSYNLAQVVASSALEGFIKQLAMEMETSHLSVCGVKLDAEFYNGSQASQGRRAAIVTELAKIIAATGKRYNGRILTSNQ